jgi:hypothetical protein
MDLMKIPGGNTVGNKYRCEWKTKCKAKSPSMRAGLKETLIEGYDPHPRNTGDPSDRDLRILPLGPPGNNLVDLDPGRMIPLFLWSEILKMAMTKRGN